MNKGHAVTLRAALLQPTGRRALLSAGLGAATGALAALSPAVGPFVRRVRSEPFLASRTASAQGVFPGYGPLIPDPNPRPILDLPEGFPYRVLIERGDRLSNGDPWPGQADAMAAYPLDHGRILLVVNHENTYRSDRNVVPVLFDEMYDREAAGGTTALVISPDLNVEYAYVTSAGTAAGCLAEVLDCMPLPVCALQVDGGSEVARSWPLSRRPVRPAGSPGTCCRPGPHSAVAMSSERTGPIAGSSLHVTTGIAQSRSCNRRCRRGRRAILIADRTRPWHPSPRGLSGNRADHHLSQTS